MGIFSDKIVKTVGGHFPKSQVKANEKAAKKEWKVFKKQQKEDEKKNK